MASLAIANLLSTVLWNNNGSTETRFTGIGAPNVWFG